MNAHVITIEALRKAMERGENAGYVEIAVEDCPSVQEYASGARLVLGREPTIGEAYGVGPPPEARWIVEEHTELDGVPHVFVKLAPNLPKL